MSGWSNWGIKRKLFAVIVLLLALQVIILLFAGSYLFEQFYTASKTAEMKNRAQSIRDAYAQSSETFYDEIDSAEYENVVVTLYAFGPEGELQTVYHSRSGHDANAPWRNRPDMPPAPEDNQQWNDIPEGFVERLKNTSSGFDIHVDIPEKTELSGRPQKDPQGKNPQEKNPQQKDSQGKVLLEVRRGMPDGSISLVTRLDDNLYLDIFTPRGYIKSTADLAVKYTAQLSIIILLLGSVAIYFVVGRLTRPISRIQEVADKIARLDFTQKCEITSGDEISRLGQSINDMSDKLESAIGKLVSANEVLKSDLERQQQTERIRRGFIADVSHDFKTPLTLMISYAEALSEEREGRDKEYCDVIISEGNRLSTMVGRLLELSRLENGADPVEWSIFCLSEIVDEAVGHHRILTEKKRISVTKTLDEEFIVHADFQKIVRVVTNLVDNAVKYTPENGRIAVHAGRRGGVCRLEVENTGEPIAEADQERLFDSFYRGDKSRGGSHGSYGIGLATVRAIMEAHGREYGVENIDDGVRFWIELETADFDEEPEDDPDEILEE